MLIKKLLKNKYFQNSWLDEDIFKEWLSSRSIKNKALYNIIISDAAKQI